MSQEIPFKMLPSQVPLEIGGSCESLKAKVQRKDGLSVEAKVFSIIATAQGRKDATFAIEFEGAQPLRGARFLEDPSLRINSDSSTLEPTRHWRFTYNH